MVLIIGNMEVRIDFIDSKDRSLGINESTMDRLKLAIDKYEFKKKFYERDRLINILNDK